MKCTKMTFAVGGKGGLTMAKNTIEELDRGQLELMWNFLKMGNGCGSNQNSL